MTLFQQTLIIKWEKQPVWENCISCPSTQSPSKIYLKASSKFFSTSVPSAILWIWLKKCASKGRLKLKNKNGNFWENGSDSYQKEWNNFPPSLSNFSLIHFSQFFVLGFFSMFQLSMMIFGIKHGDVFLTQINLLLRAGKWEIKNMSSMKWSIP